MSKSSFSPFQFGFLALLILIAAPSCSSITSSAEASVTAPSISSAPPSNLANQNGNRSAVSLRAFFAKQSPPSRAEIASSQRALLLMTLSFRGRVLPEKSQLFTMERFLTRKNRGFEMTGHPLPHAAHRHGLLAMTSERLIFLYALCG